MGDLPALRAHLERLDRVIVAFSGGADEPLLGGETGALVVFGGGVLRQLREREVGVAQLQRRLCELGLEGAEAGEVGTERHHAEVGLVAEHREQEHLVPVGLQRRHRVDDALGAVRIGLRAFAVDAVEEVEDTPADGRFDGFHDGQPTDGSGWSDGSRSPSERSAAESTARSDATMMFGSLPIPHRVVCPASTVST